MEINEKAILLIKSLFDGNVILINGEYYTLCDNYEICVRRETDWSTGRGYVWIKVFGDTSLSWYRKLAEKLTNEQLLSLSDTKVVIKGRKID
jgi:hypothetical protein